jgi:hypothetical protein
VPTFRWFSIVNNYERVCTNQTAFTRWAHFFFLGPYFPDGGDQAGAESSDEDEDDECLVRVTRRPELVTSLDLRFCGDGNRFGDGATFLGFV